MACIRSFFHLLGRAIGSWPFCFGFASLAIGLLLSAGMARMHLKDYIRDGYTPANAPSRVETAAMRQFWNASGDPMKAMVMIRSKFPDQNMLRLDLLSEAVELNHFLMRQFSPSIDGTPNGTFTYEDLCPPFCEFNFGLELFVDGLTQAMGDLGGIGGNGEQRRNRHQNLSFPLATVHSFNIRMELYFFGVNLRTGQFATAQSAGGIPEQQLTNIKSIKMVLLSFHAERSSPMRARQLSIWEMAVFDYLQNQYHSDFLDVQIIGMEILDNEMTRDHRENVHFFALGFLAMSAFVCLNVFGTTRMDAGKVAIAAATVLCPLLAISSTFGAISWFGLRTNSFLLILPYLILGIGVDDGFLLMHRWFQLANNVRQPAKRLAMVFSEVGPSITVTTLTNVISFGVGAFTPTPEIRLFCFGTALALSLDYALQLTLFCPVMLFSARFEHEDEEAEEKEGAKEKGKKENAGGQLPSIVEGGSGLEEPGNGTRKYSPFKMEQRANRGMGGGTMGAKMFNWYCALLANKCFAAILLILLGLYWAISLLGSERIQTKLDIDKILPRDSKMRETSRLLDQHVWANHLPITVLFNGPLNISSAQQMARFWSMVNDFEAIPNSKGPQSSLIWLRDYERFYWDEDDSGDRFDQLIGELDMEETDRMMATMKRRREEEEEMVGKKKKGRRDAMDLCRLDEFLDTPFYAQWTAFLRIKKDGGTNETGCSSTISAFTISFAFRHILGWDLRIELMQNAREIAAHHSRLLGPAKVTVWEENGMFVDQMLSLRSVTVQSGMLTLGCMALVCAFFVPNPVSVLFASASICSISIGVLGFLSWLGFDLDPVTMAASLMSIGLSVDFTAHVIYHFRQDFRHEFCRDSSPDGFTERLIHLATRGDKLRYTLESVGWPMLQSGISTALCICPLLFVRKYAPTVFANAVFLVCGWGLVHGLLLLPCILCLLPKWCSSRIGLSSLASLRGLFAAKGEFRVQDGGEKKPSIVDVDEEGRMKEEKEDEKKMKEEGNGQAVLMSQLLEGIA